MRGNAGDNNAYRSVYTVFGPADLKADQLGPPGLTAAERAEMERVAMLPVPFFPFDPEAEALKILRRLDSRPQRRSWRARGRSVLSGLGMMVMPMLGAVPGFAHMCPHDTHPAQVVLDDMGAVLHPAYA